MEIFELGLQLLQPGFELLFLGIGLAFGLPLKPVGHVIRNLFLPCGELLDAFRQLPVLVTRRFKLRCQPVNRCIAGIGVGQNRLVEGLAPGSLAVLGRAGHDPPGKEKESQQRTGNRSPTLGACRQALPHIHGLAPISEGRAPAEGTASGPARALAR